jgi:dihydrofolate reductase
MIGIIAVNNLGFIGKDNKLLWHNSEDLKHFKAIRQGRKMLVGHNTYQELPDVVKRQKITVDERDKLFQDSTVLMSTTEGVESEVLVELLCIGGKKTYEKYCHMFTELHISHIDDNSIGDCTFPDLSNLSPTCEIFNYNF